MNKYQEAIYRLWHVHFAQDIPEHSADEEFADWQLMKELVLKATPRKVIITNRYYPNKRYKAVICPHCKDELLGRYDDFDKELDNVYEMNYCLNCGQALDWSDSDE